MGTKISQAKQHPSNRTPTKHFSGQFDLSFGYSRWLLSYSHPSLIFIISFLFWTLFSFRVIVFFLSLLSDVSGSALDALHFVLWNFSAYINLLVLLLTTFFFSSYANFDFNRTKGEILYRHKRWSEIIAFKCVPLKMCQCQTLLRSYKRVSFSAKSFEGYFPKGSSQKNQVQ